MRSTTLLVIFCATRAFAADAPPPPAAEPKPSAWACSRTTLLSDQPCTIEGKTQAQAASKDQAKENQRQAQILADEVCTAIAKGEEAEPDASLEKICKARVASATKKCGGDGTRRLLDDAGRFNPGHARCYAAIGEMVRDIVSLRDSAGACCACVERSCSVNAGQCIERHADGKAIGAPAACIEGVCAADCAQLQLVQPQKPAGKKP
jgi:hypothetical protein